MTPIVVGGRLRGGPLRLGPLVAFCVAAGCGGVQGGPRNPAPVGQEAIGRPVEAYEQLGFIVGPGYFPAVADFATLAGPADSTYLLFGLSLPNSALRFQRDETGFVAEYIINLTFSRDSVIVRTESRREPVRVPTFAETSRTEESIVFQHLVTLEPGTWIVSLQAADANSSRGFRSVDTLNVPAYGARDIQLATPVVIYEGTGRVAADSVPDLILNPRHTVPYGGAAPRIYVETYGTSTPSPIIVSVLDEADNTLWSAQADVADGDSTVRRAILELPSSSLPLGKLFVEVTAVATGVRTRTPLLISISDQWLVTDFAEVLEFLDFIGTRAEIDSLRRGTPGERRRLWDGFWARRDPLPNTPENEYRDDFFDRVRFATEQFNEAGGLPGWLTDRGEVYIVLGPPTFAQDRYVGRQDVVGRPNAIEWLYDNAPGGRLVLLFLDRNGFGRFELTPSSMSAFRGIVDRMKREWEGR